MRGVVGLYLQLPKKEIRLFFEPVTIRGRHLTEREKDRADEKRHHYSGNTGGGEGRDYQDTEKRGFRETELVENTSAREGGCDDL